MPTVIATARFREILTMVADDLRNPGFLGVRQGSLSEKTGLVMQHRFMCLKAAMSRDMINLDDDDLHAAIKRELLIPWDTFMQHNEHWQTIATIMDVRFFVTTEGEDGTWRPVQMMPPDGTLMPGELSMNDLNDVPYEAVLAILAGNTAYDLPPVVTRTA